MFDSDIFSKEFGESGAGSRSGEERGWSHLRDFTIMNENEKNQGAIRAHFRTPSGCLDGNRHAEFFEGRPKFGGGWKKILRAGLGARNERKLQRGGFA
jgi:hypothetical protein